MEYDRKMGPKAVDIILKTNLVELYLNILWILSKVKFCNKKDKLETGIYNSKFTKPNYKTELRIMTSQTELLTHFIHLNFSS